MRKIHVIVFLLFLAFAAQAQNLKLWYSKPAQHWTEALPLGKSCSNSNNQWITTDIVIFVEYL